MRRFVIGMVVMLLLATGCSSSKGNSAAPGTGTGGTMTPLTPDDIGRALAVGVQAAIERTAGAVPRFGSVTQGSNVRNGITTDSVDIVYSPHGTTFHPIATIRTATDTLRSNNDPTRMDLRLPSGQLIHVDPTSDWVAKHCQVGDGCEIWPQELDHHDLILRHPPSMANNDDGTREITSLFIADLLDDSIKGALQYTSVIVDGYTDYPSASAAGDDDHVSWGIWTTHKVSTYTVDNIAYGAFADGVKTPVGNIPVRGVGFYEGHTVAAAMKGGTIPADGEAYGIRGRVTLTANFSDGLVSGQVDNFVADDANKPSFLDNLTIDLNNASIASGTFKGDARAIGGLVGATGKWGGRFFGTPDDPGDRPSTTGGTWGVTQGTGADDWKIIGGFGSWLTTRTPAPPVP